MRRLIRATCAACAVSVLTATAALAAAPVAPGCVGESVSAFAAANGRDFGLGAVATTARLSTQGVGDEVQLIQAGEFPDEAFPNTCND